MWKDFILKRRPESIFDIYTLVGGLFLLSSPWLLGLIRRPGIVDAEVVGFLIVAVSLAAVVAFAEWEEWINAALGVWLIVAPWILGFAHTKAMHVSIAVGIVVTYLALLELWLIRERAHEAAASNARSDHS